MGARRANIGYHLHNMIAAKAGIVTPYIIFKSEDGVLLCYGTTVPTTVNTYAAGCILIKVGATADVLYVNKGTFASPSFERIVNTNDIVSEIESDYLGGTAGGTGPSPLIWDGAPVLQTILDPTDRFYYFNDFLGEIDSTTGDGWTLTATTTGTIAGVAEEGGAIIFDSAGNTTADDGIEAQLKNCMVKPVAGTTIYFEARVKMKNTGDDQYYIGLAGVDTSLMATGVVDDVVDKCGFFRDSGIVPADDKLSTIISRTSTENESADEASVADNTYVKLGFVINGLTDVKFYVDGVLVQTNTTTASIPNAVMCLSFVAKVEQTSADAELTVDWVRILQTGSRA